jgi:hypothetical protein
MTNLARISLFTLAIGVAAILLLAWLFAEVMDQSGMRAAYQIWLENQTFIAAIIAVLAAGLAARPVYMQVKAQSVTAALDLLHRLEAESQANVDAHTKLYDLRRAVVALSGEINAYGQDLDMVGLKSTITGLLSFNAREIRSYSDRPTIGNAERTKLVALSAVLTIAQQVAVELLTTEKNGLIPPEAVAAEQEFIGIKLAGLFSLASEIAEDLEAQEVRMRERAAQLREAANTAWV